MILTYESKEIIQYILVLSSSSLLSLLTKYPRVSNMDLNETERWEIFKFEFVAYPRIWLFGNVVDGIWILLPIAVFGTIVNSFLVR